MKFVFLFLSFIAYSQLSAQNITPSLYSSFNEYKINQSHYRVLQTQCGDKLFYFYPESVCWENIELEVCDTTGCYIHPVTVVSLNVVGNILTIYYQCLGQELWRYVYLNKRGTPDWKMTENEEEWQRY